MPATGNLTAAPLLPSPAVDERRERSDRREQGTAGRRGSAKNRKRRIAALAGDLAAIVVLVAAIVFAVNNARPIFAGQPTVVQSLTERVPITKPVLAPAARPDTGRLATLMASPQFAADSAAF